MTMWQVVEKEDFGTDWHMVRYNDHAMQKFNSKEEAIRCAKDYVTSLNCDNSLTKEEKRNSFEGFMILDEGCFLGILDRKEWYLSDKNGNLINNKNNYELQGKTEVSVRQVPGT